MEQYHKASEEATLLFARKNHEYGDAIKETGVLGAVVELVGVTARLKQLVLADSNYTSKEIHDKLVDGLNYCAIGLMMEADKNWNGTINES